jgi:CHAT domain-containing protein
MDRGDGIENLALAFVGAGVPTVIATLWDLPDTVSSATMSILHRELTEGIGPARAVQRAVLSEIRDDKGSIRWPLSWASLVAVGGGREFIHKER